MVLLPAFILGILYNAFTAGWSGLELSLLGMLLGLGILIIPFMAGLMGAGDVKLLAVIGAIKGSVFVLYTSVFMSLAGGVIAVLILIYQQRLWGTVCNLCRGSAVMVTTGFKIVNFGSEHARTMFPYATAIFAGALGAMWLMR